MWYLTSEVDHRVIYIAGQNKEITIGRSADAQQRSFVIPDDPSISRKHATLTNLHDELFLQDLGSRYGTFVNNGEVKVESNSMIKLNDKDIVKFGKMGSVWIVHAKSFVTCTSTLKGENLQNLKTCLTSLSGTLKSDWDSTCKYLTMPAITLTMKVVLALVQGAHIVTVEFWSKCLEAVNSQMALPDPNNFTPQIIESTLNKEVVSFLPDDRRKSLLLGKKVVFFSKRQFDMYKAVLTNASASPLLLSESKMSKSMLCEKDVFVIQYNLTSSSQETQTQRNSIVDIVNYLKSKGKRVITDVEIGLAVLYCSTDKYCNPDFNFPSEVIKQTDQTAKNPTVLAQETQEYNYGAKCKKENVVINESLTNTSMSDKNNSFKRKMSDDDIQNNMTKKFAAGSAGHEGGIKRKVDESNDTKTNPSKKHATEFDEDGFNFVNSGNSDNTSSESTIKRLNLAKPQKRKLDCEDEEDDLFQFIQDRSKIPANTSKSNIFGANNSNTDSNTHDHETNDRNSEINNVDLSALRGSKLDELMKNNEKFMKSENTTLKKIKEEELDEKMNELTLGTTIVKVRPDLIIKKEPIAVEEQSSQVKNFKKFKKVWPIKMQVTIIPRSSMSIYKVDNSKDENSSTNYNEQENNTIPNESGSINHDVQENNMITNESEVTVQ
ncbi:nibrin [Ostrinia furnacalis]|uniref:nibrin n=1 Tax=Ostrinia furnacalis TaxID=93504 RepID=UPI001039CF0F|nr:nibrin [Ostrinia furnacalis]